MQSEIGFSRDTFDGHASLVLKGAWTASSATALEQQALELEKSDGKAVHIDLGQIGALDTAGAWLIDRARARLVAKGAAATIINASEAQKILLEEAKYRSFDTGPQAIEWPVVNFFVDVGATVVGAGRDLYGGVEFLGRFMVTLGVLVRHPKQFRFTSLVAQIERIAFGSVPIITLINFLVGCIVAQQGIYQLQKFGAAPFSVDLIGILVLRELAVLLTSIMIAGRSGSAITAELGSMKMREEIDALQVMGLDPTAVLIVPRILALIISLPILTFLADMAALFGGLLTAWVYGDIGPEVFLDRLQQAIALNTFMVGLIKAPFMALVIGLNACVEGLAVGGSAESLGQQVTASVVKSIFAVIVVDGLFAMYFVAIHY